MPEHTLILLRHAKSDWSGNEPDEHRPLAKRGLRQAPEAGQWLAGHIDRIDLAVVSPAVRARSTWELASAELEVRRRRPSSTTGCTPPPPASCSTWCRELDDEHRTVVLVGHNPGMEGFVHLLTGDWVEMVTSALAVIDLPGRWAEASAAPARCVPPADPLPDAG